MIDPERAHNFYLIPVKRVIRLMEISPERMKCQRISEANIYY